MGYSPQDHKKSDTTEVTWHTLMCCCQKLYQSGFSRKQNQEDLFREEKKKKKERTFDVRDFPVLVEESGKFKLCRVSQQAGDSERN